MLSTSAPRLQTRLTVVRRRDVFDVGLVIFLADIVRGAISPTLSLYARSLGASLGFLGGLAATVGVVRLTLSVPIGALSDVSRKWVLVGACSSSRGAPAPSPLHAPPRCSSCPTDPWD
jgi:hypothetical protein